MEKRWNEPSTGRGRKHKRSSSLGLPEDGGESPAAAALMIK